MAITRFTQYIEEDKSPFEKYFSIFKELILHTSGDVEEALDWLRQLDKEYQIGDEDYTVDDFIEELLDLGYLRKEIRGGTGDGPPLLTAKAEKALRAGALEQIFGQLKKSGDGNHRISDRGIGDEPSGDKRTYQYGDAAERIDMTASLYNAQINHGLHNDLWTENDFIVEETHFKAQMSTVLMIDISHSMILYGEDRITPAKKVALALAELITTRYPKDSLDILVFGDDAWPIDLKDLPYLNVGPYHTNTVAGLELAMDLLRRRRNSNKQIFMLTDGKPSCLKEPDGTYYKNSFGLDDYITGKCLTMASQARRLNIPITTFMLARDPYLQQFVDDFTKANKGKAFFTGLRDLGTFIFQDYERNRRKNIR